MYPDLLPPRSPPEPAPRRLKPAHLAVIAVVGVAALGLMGLKYVTLPGPAPVAAGEGLRIEVVAPVEPELVPGSVMEVGALVDGFRYVAPAGAPRGPVHGTAWVEDEVAPYAPPSRPAGVRRYTSDAWTPPPEPEPPRRERERRWFGFDNPLPDFRAERRARQARMDALEDQRRAEREDRPERRRYSSEPPRYEDRRDDRRHDNPSRDERPEQPADGPYGPEVG